MVTLGTSMADEVVNVTSAQPDQLGPAGLDEEIRENHPESLSGDNVITAAGPASLDDRIVSTGEGVTFFDYIPAEPLPFPGFIPVSFLCLTQTSRIRNICLRLMLSRVSMAVILINCVTLALYQPCDGICDTPGCHVLAIIDHLIFTFFTLEMLIKMIAMGILGKKTYLADSWNRLDFFIVFSGLIEYMVNIQNMNLSAIRTIRVLRPLRAINRVPSMRILVMLLLDTLPMLGSTFLLAFFVFFSFGIVGVQLWAGLLRNRCALSGAGNATFPRGIPKYYEPQHTYLEYVCSLPKDDGMHSCANLPPYVENNKPCNGSLSDLIWTNNTASIPAHICIDWHQYYTVCRASEKNPFLGAISFDNIGTAWVAIFLVISLEGWSEIMYLVQDAHSFYVFIYFVILIVIGSFFMINLCLVVIATQFSETKKRETDRMIAERARYHSTSSLGSAAPEPASCYSELVRYTGHLWRRAKRKAKAFYTEVQERRIKDQLLKRTAQGYYGKEGFTRPVRQTSDMSCERHPDTTSGEGSVALVPFDYARRVLLVQNTTANMTGEPTGQQQRLDNKSSGRSSSISFADNVAAASSTVRSSLPVDYPAKSNPDESSPELTDDVHAETTIQSETNSTGVNNAGRSFGKYDSSCSSKEVSRELPAVSHGTRPTHNRNCELDETSCFWAQDEEPAKKENVFFRLLAAGREPVRKFVNTNIFQRGILVAILINTLSMGVEHHLQPPELTAILEYCNFFFTALFCVEMLCKMTADGVFGYLSNGYNLFDFVIVVLSLIEIFQAGGSGLSVLRTFRLLRILKLVRFMPALKRQLVIMIKTMDNVATFFALLILFIFIFSVLGRHLFANKFCSLPNGDDCKCADFKIPNNALIRDRRNFDTLLTSTLTVFQILTQEDWNYVLYLAMRYTSHWAAIYFIALMTFGNYVLFNLLVAILVEGFADEDVVSSKDSSKASSSPKNRKNSKHGRHSEGELYDTPYDESRMQLRDDETPVPVGPVSDNQTGNRMLSVPVIMRTAATPVSMHNLNHAGGFHDQFLHVPQRSGSNSSGSSDGISSLEGERNVHDETVSEQRSMSQWECQRSERELDLEEFRAHPFRFSVRKRRKKTRAPGTFDRLRSHSLANPFDPQVLFLEFRKTSETAPGEQVFPSSSQRNGRVNLNGSPSSGTTRKSCLKQGGPVRSLSVGRAPRSRSGTLTRPLDPEPQAKETLEGPPRRPAGSPQSLRFDSTCSVYPLSRRDSEHGGRRVVSLARQESDTGSVVERVQDVRRNRAESHDDNESLSRKKIWWLPQRFIWLRKRYYYSYFIFPPTNKFRLFCARFSDHKAFDYVILFCIGLNCITLAVERPSIPPDSHEKRLLEVSNYVFTVIFAIEMALKTIGHGVFVGRQPYCQSGWNIMDGILVVISLVDVFITMVFPSKHPRIFGILRVFRLLRSLRPLRVINRAPGLKLVVETLLTSLRPIGNIVLISAIFFLIFGILGVQLFKGTFWHCVGPPNLIKSVRNRSDCEGLRYHGAIGVSWINRKYNFDNVGQALMALFVLSSKDGWVQIMYNGLDAVGVDQQPVENFNEWRLLFFISFLLLVGFFVLNMFVGVVVENFHRCREEQEAEERARRAVKRAERLERKRQKLRAPPYYANYSRIRLYQHNVVTSKYFDLAIALVIGLNVVTMALEYYLMPNELLYALKIFNYFFTAVFFFEAFFKLVALGVRRYISDRWNQLDVAIVILSVVGIILEEMENDIMVPINPTIIRVMRVLRIARILKLLKMARGIRALLDTVFQALPQVTNLGTLFFLLFFIFSTLGVELFGKLECDDQHPCEGLGEHAHFRNFGMAFLTLFRVATGDNWNGIMKDALREDCRSDDGCITNCCVSPIIAPIYFVIFVLLAQFTLVNVVVAVLMRHLQESNQIMRDDVLLDEEIERELHLEHLRQLQRHDAELARQQELEEAAAANEAEILLRQSSGSDPMHISRATSLNNLPPSLDTLYLTPPEQNSAAVSLPNLPNEFGQNNRSRANYEN